MTVNRLEISYLNPSEVKAGPHNPRVHSKKQIKQIARSISTFGFNVPIIVNEKKELICGHGRLLAAVEIGLAELPTILLEHLSDAQTRAFMIADNKLTENAEWDQKLLAEQLKILSEQELNFSIDVTGFEIGEIDVMIEGLEPIHDEESDPADALPHVPEGPPVSKHGDLWLLGKHRIYCGSSLENASFLQLMQNSKAALIFSDPPYNVPIDGHATGLGVVKHKDFAMAAGEMTPEEFITFLKASFQLLAEHSSDGSIHFICMDWRHLHEILEAGKVYTELKNLCVWVKDNGGMGSFYRSRHELIFVFKSGTKAHRNNFELGQYGRYRTNVWEYPGVNSFSRNSEEGNLLELHPTVKPVSLVSDCIMDCSNRGDIILDSFLGSGTTVIAAERTGRTCYGIELDPVYVDTAIRRWQKFTGLKATHAGSGQYFDEMVSSTQEAAYG